MKRLGFLLLMVAVLLAGCVTSNMEVTKTLKDGSEISYSVALNALLQNFKGSDMAASLDPDGKTTMKAGAVQSDTSQIAADTMDAMVKMVEALLPYIATTTPAATIP